MRFNARVCAILILVGLTGLVATVVCRRGHHDTYALIVVTETNTRGLLSLPAGGDIPRAVTLDEPTRSLRPLRPEYAPDHRTRALVVYEVDCTGVRVFSEAHRVRSLPYHIEVGEPIAALSAGAAALACPAPAGTAEVVSAPAGTAGWGSPLVDNTMRLYSTWLTVTSIEKDGTVVLEVGDRRVTLKPGEAWAEARVRDGSALLDLSLGPVWEQSLRRAFACGEPVTRLDIFNYGLWRRERVEECAY